jgi:hypothetical protein
VPHLKRREPLSLPHAGQVPLLVGLIEGRDVEPQDPEAFVAAVLHHRFSSLAAEAIAAGTLRLPEDEASTLRDVAGIRALSTRALESELGAIEPVLEEACGAGPLLLKGPAAARHHPDPALRTFVDLDLLLPRESLGRSADALEARGYQRFVEFDPEFGEAHGHDVHVRRKVGIRNLDVELHWRVGDDPLGEVLTHERLSASAARMTVGGREVAVPSPSWELIVLALHLLSDRGKRLIWLVDLRAAGLAAGDEDWAEGFRLADRHGLLWVLHRALDYVERHLGFERPRPLAAGPPPAWGPLRAVEEIDAPASLHVGRLAGMRTRERAAYLRRVLVPSREGLRDSVGADGAPMWRLVGRHMRAAAAGLRPRR